MSRREHITEQSYIDWLKSLGCMFYAPFTETSVDLISSTLGTLYGNINNFSSDGVYLNGNSRIVFPKTLFSWMGYNSSWTILVDFKLTQYAVDTNYPKIYCFDYSQLYNMQQNNLSVGKNGNVWESYTQIRYTNYRTVLLDDIQLGVFNNKYGQAYNGNEHKMYGIYDGMIHTSVEVDGYNNDMPLTIGSMYNIGNHMKGYVRNFMIFNNMLTQQQIAQL